MSTKTTTMTTEALADDRQRVQGVRDDGRGGNGSMTVPLDWKRQLSIDISYYCVANSNTVSWMSCFDIVFIELLFLFTARNTISTAIIRKIFLYQVYTNLAYVPFTYRRIKTLRVLMINKYLYKSLARKNGNKILIWI